MSSFIPFLDESETPYNQEDVIKARTMIMENLNNLISAGMKGSPAMKVELISKIQEQVLNYAPAMKVLEEIIDDLLAFSYDVSQDVKKTIVGFIEEVCKQKIRMLPRVVKSLVALLREESAMVVKRVIQACGSIYKNTLQWLCSTDDVSEEMQDCWTQLCYIKTQIVDLIDHENDGIRTNAIKFLEGVIILQSYADADSLKRENDFSLDNVPKTSPIVDKQTLEEEAKNIFEILLKFHSESHISSVNLIACTGTLCSIAKLRPSVMAQVVDALTALNSNLPPTLTNSQVSSVRKNLKMQFINLLKLPASFEFRQTITSTLSDLGATPNEISRALPKMDPKETQMRKRRAAENLAARNAEKKAKIEKKEVLEKPRGIEMEVTEKTVTNALKSVEIAAYLAITTMSKLPDSCPDDFLQNYKPGVATPETIAKLLMPQIKPEPTTTVLESPDDYKKDETARKLRETLEKLRGEPKMKQRVKTLKLQEISKPLHRDIKQQFLTDAVKRILKCERQAVVSGMGMKRKKIITVFASTFMPSVREIIMNYIKEDIVKRFDLAFMWIFEEYSLLQGFTRHSYLKSEHKHDHAYNLLLTELVMDIVERGSEFRERESFIKRLYLEAPLITEESLKLLIEIAEMEELSDCSLVLVKDLLIRRPPKEDVLLATLLKFCLHGKVVIRDKAIENILCVYLQHQILTEEIEKFAIKMLSFLEKPSPGHDLVKLVKPKLGEGLEGNLEDRDDFSDLSAWNENLVKLCLNLFLHLLPSNESLIHNLCSVYAVTPSEVKRVILRVIEAPLKKMGMESKELMKVIETCPKGTETIVTRITYVLTENNTPSQDFVDKVKNLYSTKLGDVRILIPIVNHLSKKEIISALPKFLKLNPQLMKDVFMRLLGLKVDLTKALVTPAITPAELLVALHAIDTSQAELKLIVKATSLCLAETSIYTHEVLGVVMQQLVEMTPLPTLLMRTVIQSHTLYPRLAGFITSLLQRLIVKQVWKFKLIWDGFIKCCLRLDALGMSVLVQLPIPQLQNALSICPDLRNPLLEHVKEMIKQQPSHGTQQILDLLLTGSSSDVEMKNVDDRDRRDDGESAPGVD